MKKFFDRKDVKSGKLELPKCLAFLKDLKSSYIILRDKKNDESTKWSLVIKPVQFKRFIELKSENEQLLKELKELKEQLANSEKLTTTKAEIEPPVWQEGSVSPKKNGFYPIRLKNSKEVITCRFENGKWKFQFKGQKITPLKPNQFQWALQPSKSSAANTGFVEMPGGGMEMILR